MDGTSSMLGEDKKCIHFRQKTAKKETNWETKAYEHIKMFLKTINCIDVDWTKEGKLSCYLQSLF
jgi:hypothetical protein